MSHLIWYPGHELILDDIVRADGCFVYDRAGRRYLDLESGVWCASVGHGHPSVISAMARQAAAVAHTGFNYTAPVVEEAAGEILALLESHGGRCVFLCSGSEAVEFAVRGAQSALARPRLLTMRDSYFGAYGSAHRRDPHEWFDLDWTECATCPRTGACDAPDPPCDRWGSIPWEEIGGLLFEPGSSSGLVRFPPERLVRAIATRVQDADGLVVVNEVTTGMGRTGRWFGYQHYGITPDIVALGKGIGNGYPVSVAAFSPRAIRLLGDQVIPYAQSHQNDPVGAAVAREVIRVIREGNLIERARETGELLLRGLERVGERTRSAGTDVVQAVRARGLMAAVELRDDAGASLTIRVQHELVHRGFLVGRRPGRNVLRIDPPLVIERAETEAFLLAFEEVLMGTTTAG